MKILFISNIPSPYRVDFFNELGKQCDLTVAFEGYRASDRNSKWQGEEIKFFKAIFMTGIRLKSDCFLCPEIIKIISANWDIIIFGGYSTPTAMFAIEYMNIKKIPFYIEADGGLIGNDSHLKYKIKRHFISSANGWLSSGSMTTKYLTHYGAVATKCYVYPFTSMKEKDFVDAIEVRKKDRSILRFKLGILEEKVIVFANELTLNDEKATFLKIADKIKKWDKTIGIYVICEKKERFLCREDSESSKIHYIYPERKEQKLEYYAAADLYISPNDNAQNNMAKILGVPVITISDYLTGSEDIWTAERRIIDMVCKRIQELFESTNELYLCGRKNLELMQKELINNNSNIKQIIPSLRTMLRDCAKASLGIKEDKMILAVGQYIYRKGYDLLLKAATKMGNNIGIYIVGGNPTEEYLQLKRELNLANVHFVGFKTKGELADYYRAADIFIHPTREDIWGLVINEAIAYFLPVITTDRCVAGLELIDDKLNGKIIKSEDVDAIIEALQINFNVDTLINTNLELEKRYSIEKMASIHLDILKSL